MITEKRSLIAKELADGTGAGISIAIDNSSRRTGLRIWFSDLDEKGGPIAELRPYGLKGHKVILSFGTFAGSTIGRMRNASAEDLQLSRALLQSIRTDANLAVLGQSLTDWTVTDSSFRVEASLRHETQPGDDSAILVTCRDVIVPLMASMAELIGYDEVSPPSDTDPGELEGGILQSLVMRRERNPRNRLLCIRIHGENCVACNFNPTTVYGPTASIIEVHHLVPLSSLAAPRAYDPAQDLIPLCPNCHRFVHTRKPTPWSLDDVKELVAR